MEKQNLKRKYMNFMLKVFMRLIPIYLKKLNYQHIACHIIAIVRLQSVMKCIMTLSKIIRSTRHDWCIIRHLTKWYIPIHIILSLSFMNTPKLWIVFR